VPILPRGSDSAVDGIELPEEIASGVISEREVISIPGFIEWNGWRSRWPFLRTIGWNIGLLILGSLLCALAINGILIPHRFVSGGVAGLALVIHYLFSFFPVALVYFLANVPLFIAGWFFISRRFFIYSTIGMLLFAVAIAWVDVDVPVEDKLLAAILAGLIQGAGSGIILKSVGSAGGTDILSVILLQRFSIRLGTTVLVFNILVLAAAVFFFSLEDALYTLIYLYVSAKIVDLVVTGLSQRKAIFIVSPEWEKISARILNEIHRGVTILHGQGA
jgi:uncharacterized membrane-anchored protein YitT (DUF2179 family)